MVVLSLDKKLEKLPSLFGISDNLLIEDAFCKKSYTGKSCSSVYDFLLSLILNNFIVEFVENKTSSKSNIDTFLILLSVEAILLILGNSVLDLQFTIS